MTREIEELKEAIASQDKYLSGEVGDEKWSFMDLYFNIEAKAQALITRLEKSEIGTVASFSYSRAHFSSHCDRVEPGTLYFIAEPVSETNVPNESGE